MKKRFRTFESDKNVFLDQNSNNYQLNCTVQFKTRNGYLPGIKMTPLIEQNDHAMITTLELNKSLGHTNVELVLNTANKIGLTLYYGLKDHFYNH